MNEKLSWVYFLSLSSELPPHFFKLSETFSKFGVMLLPLNPSQLDDFYRQDENLHIVSVTSHSEEWDKFKLNVDRRLNYLVKNKKIHLYHISSFRCELFGKKPNGHYHHLPLPEKADALVAKIMYLKHKSIPVSQVWPGGRRGKFHLDV